MKIKILPLFVVIAAACTDTVTTPGIVVPDTILVPLSGNLHGEVGQIAAPAPHVRVMNGSGKPIQGARVRFELISGGGQLTSADTVTNANGEASANWVLGTLSSSLNTVRVSAGSRSFVFSAVPNPGAPVVLTALSIADSIGLSKSVVAPLIVTVADRFGNRVSGTPVHFAIISGGGKVSGSDTLTTLSAASGYAELTTWALGMPGVNRVSAQLPGALSVEFEIMAIDSSSATWYRTNETLYGQQAWYSKLILNPAGYVILENWAGSSTNADPFRFTGRYSVKAETITLTGCWTFEPDTNPQVCIVRVGRKANDTIVLDGETYRTIR